MTYSKKQILYIWKTKYQVSQNSEAYNGYNTLFHFFLFPSFFVSLPGSF